MPFIKLVGEIPTNLNSFDTYQVYNSLDSAITAQLASAIRPQFNENQLATYQREMRVKQLTLELSTKGFPINQLNLAELDYTLEKDQNRALNILHKFCEAIGFRPINPRSTVDVAELLYDHLNLPVIREYDRSTQKYKVSTDVKALEKIRTNYPFATPFVNAILAFREPAKMRSVFKRGLEPPFGLLRCGFSQSTETGRLNSQQNVYGGGTNAQNLTDRVRQVVEAPDGYAILNFDLKTAESIAVAYLSRSRAYIDACLSGDLHTAVAKMNWTELPWTGDLQQDKLIAEQPFYRHFTYRDMAKRGGHGTNYYGTPKTMAMHLKIAATIVEEFQRLYFQAFPEIPEWHLETIARIQTDGIIVTPLKRERRFWGRSDDPATHREAIAFAPQSLIADLMNDILVAVQTWIVSNLRGSTAWRGRRGSLIPIDVPMADMRAQIHDSGVFIVPIDGLPEIASKILSLARIPIDFGDLGEMIVPGDLTVGKVWCKYKPIAKGGTKVTMTGLKDYTPGQELHW